MTWLDEIDDEIKNAELDADEVLGVPDWASIYYRDARRMARVIREQVEYIKYLEGIVYVELGISRDAMRSGRSNDMKKLLDVP